jgi:hypothetical protein
MPSVFITTGKPMIGVSIPTSVDAKLHHQKVGSATLDIGDIAVELEPQRNPIIARLNFLFI